jgi:hypothetical protein
VLGQRRAQRGRRQCKTGWEAAPCTPGLPPAVPAPAAHPKRRPAPMRKVLIKAGSAGATRLACAHARAPARLLSSTRMVFSESHPSAIACTPMAAEEGQPNAMGCLASGNRGGVALTAARAIGDRTDVALAAARAVGNRKVVVLTAASIGGQGDACVANTAVCRPRCTRETKWGQAVNMDLSNATAWFAAIAMRLHRLWFPFGEVQQDLLLSCLTIG